MLYYKCLHSLLEDANAVQHLVESHQDALAGVHHDALVESHHDALEGVHHDALAESQQDALAESQQDVLNVIVNQKRVVVNTHGNVAGLGGNPVEKVNIKNIAKKVVVF